MALHNGAVSRKLNTLITQTSNPRVLAALPDIKLLSLELSLSALLSLELNLSTLLSLKLSLSA